MKLSQHIKLKKLQKWESYLDFVKTMDKREPFAPLSVGLTEDLNTTFCENLFVYLPIYDALLKTYDLKTIAGIGTDFEKALRVMQWLTDKTFYSGVKTKWLADNSADILAYSYEKPFENAINCREKAIVLTDCLIALGLRAYPVCMLADENRGCHFTVHVYSKELKKWILFDPSFNCYFVKDGTPMNIYELRQTLLDEVAFDLVGYSFNKTDACKTVYLAGFIKQCLTNISTWHDNSMDKREYKKTDWNSKKAFRTKLPDM